MGGDWCRSAPPGRSRRQSAALPIATQSKNALLLDAVQRLTLSHFPKESVGVAGCQACGITGLVVWVFLLTNSLT